MSAIRVFVMFFVTGVLLLLSSSSAYATAATVRVSVDSSGLEANGDSLDPIISANGEVVAFNSYATNLAPGDQFSYIDAFAHDLSVSETSRVSATSTGGDAAFHAFVSSISGDGRFVVFDSVANIVPDDDNFADVYVRDLFLGTIERVSLNVAGEQANGASGSGSISADGRYVAFLSDATNLVTGDNNARSDVFVRDRLLGATERVSVDSSGNEGNGVSGLWGPVISADGQHVAFISDADNLVPGDVSGMRDVFVHDRLTDTTSIVSVNSAEQPANAYTNGNLDISADGQLVLFQSSATNLVSGDTNGNVDVFVRDRTSGTTERVTVSSTGAQLMGGGSNSALSDDGRFVGFVAGGIWIHDRIGGRTVRANFNSMGTVANGGTGFAFERVTDLSGDGRMVVFQSVATNLVSGDTNGHSDIFVRDLGDGDADGVWDPFDLCPDVANSDELNSDGDLWGDACDPCPFVATIWVTPDGDDDCDGFSTAAETALGTQPNEDCVYTPGSPNESDAWPPDLVESGNINISDALALKIYFAAPSPPARYDLVLSGTINVSDVLALKPFFGHSCTP